MFKFIKEEKKITALLVIALGVSSTYVFTNRTPELFPYGSELMLFVFSISVSVIAAVIFYILQIYLPALKLRNLAKNDLKRICDKYISTFISILVSCSEQTELDQFNIQNLNDLLDRKIANHIGWFFNPEATSNRIRQMSWLDWLVILAEETKKECDTIASKYSTHLTEDFLSHLDTIKRHPFIELSQREYLTRRPFGDRTTWSLDQPLVEYFELLITLNSSYQLGISFSANSFQAINGSLGTARVT